MYPAALAMALRGVKIEAATAAELGLAGRSDADVFTSAITSGYVVLTENVTDFARIATDHLVAGRHHPGLLIALSSRFSRRPAGISQLVAAVCAVAGEQIDDRVVYLERTDLASS